MMMMVLKRTELIMVLFVCLACRSTEPVVRRDRRESLLLLSL